MTVSEHVHNDLLMALSGVKSEFTIELLNNLHPNVFIIRSGLKKYVVHIYPPNFTNWNFDDVASAKNSKRALSIVSQIGGLSFSYPKVVADNFIDETKWICYSWLNGEILEPSCDFSVVQFQQLVRSLSKLYLDTKSDWFEKDDPFPSKSNQGYWEWETKFPVNDLERDPRKWIDPKIKNNIINALTQWKNPINQIGEFAFCHNDLVFGNVIVQSKTIGLIDWARACKSSPLRDFAYLLLFPFLSRKWNKDLFSEIVLKNVCKWKHYDSLLPFFIGTRLITSGVFSDKDHLLLASKILMSETASSALFLLKNSC